MKKITLVFVFAVALAPLVAWSEQDPPRPSGPVSLALGSGTATFWPYTGTDFSGTPSDPINLLFLGDADPRNVRQALLSVDGNRTPFGLPPVFPFNCTWADAIGRHQTAWAKADGWQGSAIQLQCGAYETLRLHLRLFREGRRTLGNVHFEVLIPGTTDHEVLSWEFAEAIVKLDLVRGGFVASPLLTPAITPTPTYRTIRHQVFNGLPVPLRAALGLPLADQTAPVPIPNDGRASVLEVALVPESIQSQQVVEFVHPFNQTIPKPFCASGPLDFLKVEGPIQMMHRVHTNPSGRYEASFTASGVLQVTPINPLTGETGETYQAIVVETHRSSLTDNRSEAHHVVSQILASRPQQSFFEDLWAGHSDSFARLVICGP